MTYRAEPQQAPLPQPGVSDESAPEGVKLEHTAKGPRWSIRVHNRGDDREQVERVAAIDRLMREKFGQPT